MPRAGDIVYLGGRFDLVLGHRATTSRRSTCTGTLTDWNPTRAADEFGVRALATSPRARRSTSRVTSRRSAGATRRDRLGLLRGRGDELEPGGRGPVQALAVDPSGSPVYVGGASRRSGATTGSRWAP